MLWHEVKFNYVTRTAGRNFQKAVDQQVIFAVVSFLKHSKVL